MNQHFNGQQQLPEQWQNALAAMRESIAQASAAMQLLASAMNELRPLFESAEALQAEFSRYTIGPNGPATPMPSFSMAPTLSPAATPTAAAAASVSPAPSTAKIERDDLPEVMRSSTEEDLEGMQKYIISFKSDGPVDMMKVHSALESIDEINGMTLNDYGPQSAELQIWTKVEPGSLPLVEALQDSFNELPKVEPTPDGLLIRFGANGA